MRRAFLILVVLIALAGVASAADVKFQIGVVATATAVISENPLMNQYSRSQVRRPPSLGSNPSAGGRPLPGTQPRSWSTGRACPGRQEFAVRASKNMPHRENTHKG